MTSVYCGFKLFRNECMKSLSKRSVINRYLSSVQIGSKAELSRIFSAEDVQSFAKLSGDTNPLHLNESYSSSTKFGKCIVHGSLLNGLVSAVLGTRVPGSGTVLVSQVLNFTKPLFIGERVCARITVTEIKKRFIDVEYVCTTDSGKEVMNGTAKLFMLESNCVHKTSN